MPIKKIFPVVNKLFDELFDLGRIQVQWALMSYLLRRASAYSCNEKDKDH